MTISVCMIVKNEEKNLAACLDCLKQIADEIVIVDTGSTDETGDANTLLRHHLVSSIIVGIIFFLLMLWVGIPTYMEIAVFIGGSCGGLISWLWWGLIAEKVWFG